MYSGIITHRGAVISITNGRGSAALAVSIPRLRRLRSGASVSIDGVCLTLAEKKKSVYHFEVIAETLRKTTLGSLLPNALVNVETSLRVGDEVGGHFVFGHVDGVATVMESKVTREETRLTIRPPRGLLRYLAPQGSVALSGVGLTVSGLRGAMFTVSLTTFTLRQTTLGKLRVGTE